MRITCGLALLVLSFVTCVFGQKSPIGEGAENAGVSEKRIARFQVNDAIFREAVSELSLEKVPGLHLGFEEVIRGRIQDNPRAVAPHFSLQLQNKSIGQILDALCTVDSRYKWSEDGGTVNIYPRDLEEDSSYLFNIRIDRLDLKDVPDPDQALTPLSKKIPDQQVGYFGPGLGNNSYEKPWTTTFEDLTVRQFVNRIAEHMGSQTAWVWEGGKGERMFTFLKGGFRTPNSAKPETSIRIRKSYTR